MQRVLRDLLLVVLTLIPGTAHAGDAREEPDLSRYAFHLVAMDVKNPDSKSLTSVGTAAFVEHQGGHYLVTAYHCVRDQAGMSLEMHNGDRVNLGKVCENEFAILPHLDLCVFKCSESGRKLLMKERWHYHAAVLNETQPVKGREIQAVGNPKVVFFADAEKPIDTFPRNEVGIGAVTDFGSFQEMLPDHVKDATAEKTNIILMSSLNIQPGYSGGPVLFRSADNRVDLIGVVEGGDPMSTRARCWAIAAIHVAEAIKAERQYELNALPKPWPPSLFPNYIFPEKKEECRASQIAPESHALLLIADRFTTTGTLVNADQQTYLVLPYHIARGNNFEIANIQSPLDGLLRGNQVFVDAESDVCIYPLSNDASKQLQNAGKNAAELRRFKPFLYLNSSLEAVGHPTFRVGDKADQPPVTIKLGQIVGFDTAMEFGIAESNAYLLLLRGTGISAGLSGGPAFVDTHSGKILAGVVQGLAADDSGRAWAIPEGQIKSLIDDSLKRQDPRWVAVNNQQKWPTPKFYSARPQLVASAQRSMVTVSAAGSKGTAILLAVENDYAYVAVCAHFVQPSMKLAISDDVVIGDPKKYEALQVLDANLAIIRFPNAGAILAQHKLRELFSSKEMAGEIWQVDEGKWLERAGRLGPQSFVSYYSISPLNGEVRGVDASVSNELFAPSRLDVVEDIDAVKDSKIRFRKIESDRIDPSHLGALIATSDARLIGILVLTPDGSPGLAVPFSSVANLVKTADQSKFKNVGEIGQSKSPFQPNAYQQRKEKVNDLLWDSFSKWEFAFRNDPSQAELFERFQEIRISAAQLMGTDKVNEPLVISVEPNAKMADPKLLRLELNGRVLGHSEERRIPSGESLLKISKQGKNDNEKNGNAFNPADMLETSEIDLTLVLGDHKYKIRRSLPKMIDYSVFVTIVNDVSDSQEQATSSWCAINMDFLGRILATTSHNYQLNAYSRNGSAIESSIALNQFSEMSWRRISNQTLDVSLPISGNLIDARFREFGLRVSIPPQSNLQLKMRGRMQLLPSDESVIIDGRVLSAAKSGDPIKFKFGDESGLQFEIDLTAVLCQLAVAHINQKISAQYDDVAELTKGIPVPKIHRCAFVEREGRVWLALAFDKGQLDDVQILGPATNAMEINLQSDALATLLGNYQLGGESAQLTFEMPRHDDFPDAPERSTNKTLSGQLRNSFAAIPWRGSVALKGIMDTASDDPIKLHSLLGNWYSVRVKEKPGVRIRVLRGVFGHQQLEMRTREVELPLHGGSGTVLTEILKDEL